MLTAAEREHFAETGVLHIAGAFSPAPFTVAANCAPPRGDTVFVSFAYGFGLLATAQTGTPTTLDCTAPPVDEPPEVAFFVRLQLEYNGIIQALAAAHGWAFSDSVNTTLDSLAGVPNQFAPFPNTAAACSGSRPAGTPATCSTTPSPSVPFEISGEAPVSCRTPHPPFVV